mmetsp:Transcript_40285/g.114044  ORF Transcript_40285/g.114044 Transcript_40285/m.114044 type:complete len:214 (+) Transcript_40285:235-876(+)
MMASSAPGLQMLLPALAPHRLVAEAMQQCLDCVPRVVAQGILHSVCSLGDGLPHGGGHPGVHQVLQVSKQVQPPVQVVLTVDVHVGALAEGPPVPLVHQLEVRREHNRDATKQQGVRQGLPVGRVPAGLQAEDRVLFDLPDTAMGVFVVLAPGFSHHQVTQRPSYSTAVLHNLLPDLEAVLAVPPTQKGDQVPSRASVQRPRPRPRCRVPVHV